MRRFRRDLLDGEMAGIEFGDPAKMVGLVWLHATGFNAITYQSILAPLGFRTRIVALDQRGHGRTTLPADPRKLKSWATYRDDVIAWLEKNAPQGVVLGGHSMGGCVALLVAGKRPDLVKGLVLVDPVILAPRLYRWFHLIPFFAAIGGSGSGMARQARRRRAQFESPAQAREKYEGRGAFRTWREPFLDDYLLDALVRIDDNPHDSDEQIWELACKPAWEAATFNAQRNRPWAALSKVKKKGIPIMVMQAEQNSVISAKVASRLLRKHPRMTMKLKRGATHFLPMEAPYDVREELSAYISRLVEGFSAAEEGPVRRTLSTWERG